MMRPRMMLGRQLRVRRLRGVERARLRLDLLKLGVELNLTRAERDEVEKYVMGAR